MKRICVDIDYYETYNRPNVNLVNLKQEPLDGSRPMASRIGAQFELDALVFATGFDAMTGALLAIDIRGRGGLACATPGPRGQGLSGPRRRGFPNLFIITGPGSPSVLSNMINSIEQHVDWITDCIDHMRKRGSRIRRRSPRPKTPG